MIRPGPSQERLRRAFPLIAVVLPAVAIFAILATAGSTLGYDYEAYVRAGQRVLHGQALYDPSVDLAGGFAIYLYPPPFAVIAAPFTALNIGLGPWPWILLLIGAFASGVLAMPVSREVRWLILLLGGIDWPVLYGLKLGQVSVLLFLLFVLAWRWIEGEDRLGVLTTIGTVVKLQPALLIGWMALTGRTRGMLIAVLLLGLTAVTTTLIVGVSAWTDYIALLGRVSAPVTTPHNFTLGAVAFQLGIAADTADKIQLVSMALTVLLVAVAIRWASGEASLLATVVATQLLSPLLWDHYAIMLLIPVAWLLQRRHWWAVLIPISTSLPLIGVTPPLVYPLAFALCLAALVIVGLRSREIAVFGSLPSWVG